MLLKLLEFGVSVEEFVFESRLFHQLGVEEFLQLCSLLVHGLVEVEEVVEKRGEFFVSFLHFPNQVEEVLELQLNIIKHLEKLLV